MAGEGESAEWLRPDPALTFETFEVADGNRFAYAAALAVADSPGRQYNPLCVLGANYAATTHILHAIGNVAQERGSDARYGDLEVFLAEDHESGSRARVVGPTVLLVDHCGGLAGAEYQTQERFFDRVADVLRHPGSQIVMGSQRDIYGYGPVLRKLDLGLIVGLL